MVSQTAERYKDIVKIAWRYQTKIFVNLLIKGGGGFFVLPFSPSTYICIYYILTHREKHLYLRRLEPWTLELLGDVGVPLHHRMSYILLGDRIYKPRRRKTVNRDDLTTFRGTISVMGHFRTKHFTLFNFTRFTLCIPDDVVYNSYQAFQTIFEYFSDLYESKTTRVLAAHIDAALRCCCCQA